MVEMIVDGLTVDANNKQQMVWLRTVNGDTMLPIVIGNTEALSIDAELTGVPPPRPLTHDLLRSILDHFDARVDEVHIVDLRDSIFYAELILSWEGERVHLDARPSDSIALALKYHAPVYMAEKVLRLAGVKRESDEGRLPGMLGGGGGSAKAPSTDQDLTRAVDDLLTATGLATSGKLLQQASTGDQIEALTRRMQEAIREERYEDAGRVRDEIARIKKKRAGS